MALVDAILAVAEAMEALAEPDDDQHSFRLRSFARELRTAVKAAEGAVPAVITPQVSHRDMIEKARAEFIGKVPKAPGARRTRDNLVGMGADPAAQAGHRKFGNEREAEVGPKAVVVVGSDGAGALVDVPGDMPVGARTEIVGRTYELRADGKLHLLEVGE